MQRSIVIYHPGLSPGNILMKQRIQKDRGFTLVELLVVIAII
ncbi:MAG: prepilin-type N-terminal cleavage/methylation domain-containing protein, partial [Planctomycetaceae bacterium]|nr:prepilin-type N-terminal cleavage/methylation domain-containing protein [Planctomycetaceae bacterium]